MSEPKPYVFLSYSSKNYEKAAELRQLLLNNGISVWMAPESIPASSDYSSVIPKAIDLCSAFVLLLTAESQESQFVNKELARAISADKKIIPLCTAGLILNDSFSFYLTNVQITFTNSENSYGQLVERINEIITPNSDPGHIIVKPLDKVEPIIDTIECRIKKNRKEVDNGKLNLYDNRMEFVSEYGVKIDIPVSDIISCKASHKMVGKNTAITALSISIILLLACIAILSLYSEPEILIAVPISLLFLLPCFYLLRAYTVINVWAVSGKHGFFDRRNHYIIDKVKKKNRKSFYSYLKIRLRDIVKLG